MESIQPSDSEEQSGETTAADGVLTRFGGLPTAIGLFLALFLLPAIAASGLVEREIVGIAIKWIVALSVIVLVLLLEGESLVSIGIVKPRLSDLGWAGVVVVSVVGMFVATGPIINALGLPTELSASMPSLAVGIASAITAGITEEILYRGYPIERLIDAELGPLAAGGITWLLFTVAHFGAGIPLGNFIQVGLAGLIITTIYIHVRSLVPVMLGHVAVDTVGVLLFFFG